MQEFFEIGLGIMTMAEHEKKFLGLVKYVRFIGDEKVKIQRFLSGLPTFYKEKIKYDEPKTLTKAIWKAKYMYEQGQGRKSLKKSWKDKKNAKSDQRRKGFKPPFNRNEPNRNHQDWYTKGDVKKEDSLGKSGRTTNPMLGMQGRSLVQVFPTQKG
jgi:hypothetical protein